MKRSFHLPPGSVFLDSINGITHNGPGGGVMKINLKWLVAIMLPISILCLAADHQGVCDLTLLITGMKSTSGYLNIAIADSEAGFIEKDKAYMQIKTRLSGPEVSMVIKGLPCREYAVSVFHDENGNNTLDRNMMGVPKESYGFSNNMRGKSGPPTYSMSRFSLQPETQTVRIILQ